MCLHHYHCQFSHHHQQYHPCSPCLHLRSEEDDPNAALARRNQTTAVILCGVIGALFDLEQEAAGKNEDESR